MKTCSKCGLEKELYEFHKDKNGKYGVARICKLCYKQYGIENKSKISERKKEYFKNNKNIVLEQQRNWRLKNKTKLSEKNKEYVKNNKIKISINKKEYYKNNRDSIVNQKKEYYDKNKINIFEKNKKYREDNKSIISKQKKEYYDKNKNDILDKAKIYYINNKEITSKKHKDYYKENKEIIIKKQTIWTTNERNNNPKYKLKGNIHSCFNQALKNRNIAKSKSLFEYTGIAYADYMAYFEKNYPVEFSEIKEKGKYHIDHIIPCSAYDFNNIEHIKLCWQPENLRIILAEENLKKSDSLDYDLIDKHGIRHLLPK